MAMNLVPGVDALNLLSGIVGGQWAIHRSPIRPILEVGFQCRVDGRFAISETSLEDTISPATLILEEAERWFNGAHVRPVNHEAERLVSCSRCKRLNAVADIEKLSLHEQFSYSERMAQLWMERAEATRRLWGS